jgi:hypothetical protein
MAVTAGASGGGAPCLADATQIGLEADIVRPPMKERRMRRIPSAPVSMIAAAMLLALGAGAARADTTVQVPLAGVLDGRSVTTVTAGGQLVIWTVPTDGGGNDDGVTGIQNAFATDAVAKLKNTPAGHTLPDDGHFPATTRHPEIVLNFSNAADATSPQTHLLLHSGTMSFPMPAASYSKVFLFFSGADNGTTIKATLTYSDSTTEVLMATVPDYYADVSDTDPVLFNLAPDLAKWSKNTTIAEANHHHITGVELHPAMATKTLTGIKIDRGMSGYLLFWGATGVATSAVAGLPDAGAPVDAGGTSPVDAGGGAGAAGTGGASGAGGTNGTAGASGGAGGQTATGTAGAGAAGTSGTAGATSPTGAAGATSSTGAAGAPAVVHDSPKSGGCSLADATAPGSRAPLFLVLGAVSAWCVSRRRQR